MSSARLLGAGLALGLAACDPDGSVGYIEIKTVPVTSAPALYLDTTKLEPVRNGTAVLRQKVGTAKLQINGEAGQLALLCNIVVQKNRITSVTVSSSNRPPRCQCGRNGPDSPPNRTCVA